MAMMARTMPTKSSARDDEELYERVAQILEQARGQVARSVNTAMVQAYWLVGREIVVVEQAGSQRAGYGQNVLARLAARLKASFGKGFSVQNLGYMRQFYLAFPQGSALPEISRHCLANCGTGRFARHRLVDLARRRDGYGRSGWWGARPGRRLPVNRRWRRCSRRRLGGRTMSS
jgi:hypothetical protein